MPHKCYPVKQGYTGLIWSTNWNKNWGEQLFLFLQNKKKYMYVGIDNPITVFLVSEFLQKKSVL